VVTASSYHHDNTDLVTIVPVCRYPREILTGVGCPPQLPSGAYATKFAIAAAPYGRRRNVPSDVRIEACSQKARLLSQVGAKPLSACLDQVSECGAPVAQRPETRNDLPRSSLNIGTNNTEGSCSPLKIMHSWSMYRIG
jgi:hypothetical protein